MEELVKDITSDLWSFQLSVIGVAISVLTLLFASHVGKAEAYQHVSKRKADINDEFLSIYLSNGIKTYKKLSGQILYLLVTTLVGFLFTTIIKYLESGCLKYWLTIVDILLTALILVWSICLVVSVYNQYKKETK